MPARTVIRDGRKYCTGHCGRWLPLVAFYLNGRGYPNSECRDCGRISARERMRAAYRKGRAA